MVMGCGRALSDPDEPVIVQATSKWGNADAEYFWKHSWPTEKIVAPGRLLTTKKTTGGSYSHCGVAYGDMALVYCESCGRRAGFIW